MIEWLQHADVKQWWCLLCSPLKLRDYKLVVAPKSVGFTIGGPRTIIWTKQSTQQLLRCSLLSDWQKQWALTSCFVSCLLSSSEVKPHCLSPCRVPTRTQWPCWRPTLKLELCRPGRREDLQTSSRMAFSVCDTFKRSLNRFLHDVLNCRLLHEH